MRGADRSLPGITPAIILNTACGVATSLLLVLFPLVEQVEAQEVLYRPGGYALQYTPEGVQNLFILDEQGAIARSIAITDGSVRLSRGEVYAVLHAQPPQGERLASIFAISDARLGQFPVAPGRDLAIGRESAAIHPFALHSAGTPFEIDFVGLEGRDLPTYARPDLTLFRLSEQAGGHWVAYSGDAGGAQHLHAFSPRGDLLWEFTAQGGHQPVVEISPTAQRAAVGILAGDLRTSRLHLLDRGGGVVDSREVPGFQLAVFDSRERFLLLAGRSDVQLLAAQDGAEIWSRREDLALAPGAAATFSRDGSRFYVVSHRRRFGAGPDQFWLRVFSNLDADTQLEERLLDDVAAEGKIHVVDFQELADGRLQLVTSRGVWLLDN